MLGEAVWGNQWMGLTVSCRYDDAAVVAIVNSGRSRMDRALHRMRCLSFFLARWGVTLVCRHILGVLNGAVDAMSRNHIPSFQWLMPEAVEEPTALPVNLLECLVHRISDWTSINWTTLFGRSCLAFFGFLRAGELTVLNESAYNPSVHLSLRDVAVDDPEYPAVLSV